MLALFVLAAVLASANTQLLNCNYYCKDAASAANAHALFPDVCSYCDYTCSNCFCDGGALTKLVCVETCDQAWYKVANSSLVGPAATFGIPGVTDWTCSTGDNSFQNKVCGFACACSGNGNGAPDDACTTACKSSLAASAYNTYCKFPL